MPASPVLVLIGPAAAGKSTVGELAAGILGVPFVDLDDVGGPYYAEVGWSIARLVERIGRIGRVAAEREWEPARAHAVGRAVHDHPGAVLALGAGHTSFTDADCLAEWLDDPGTRSLATGVVITNRETPAATAARLAAAVRDRQDGLRRQSVVRPMM